jgi:hypothetical protein
MAYFCPECGNEETFKGYQDYTESGTERIFFNGEGDIDDYGDRDSTDSDTGDWHDLECAECGFSGTIYYDEDDIIRMKREKGLVLNEWQIERAQKLEIEEKGPEIDWKERIKNATRGKKNVRI